MALTRNIAKLHKQPDVGSKAEEGRTLRDKNRKPLPIRYQKLLRHAMKARRNAYCPFSQFSVGAAVLTSDGCIFTGANVENSSYGMTNCAERSAIFKAISEGKKNFVAIAIVADTIGPCAPCGGCRQVIYEFGDEITVVMANLEGCFSVEPIKTLLPFGFRLNM